MSTPSSPDPSDDLLHGALRELGAQHIPDDNFSQRVRQAMPPPRSRAKRRRMILPLAGALVGTAICLPSVDRELPFPVFDFLPAIEAPLSQWLSHPALALYAGAFSLALVVAASYWALGRQRL